MSAKAITVCPNFAALQKHVQTLLACTNFVRIHKNMRIDSRCIEANIVALRRNTESWEPQLNFQKNYFDNYYNWEVRKTEWKIFLEGLLRLKEDEKNNKS